jgi:His-Xaa-Ser system protein HxsD
MIVREAGESGIQVIVDAALFGEAVVFKCFYWYGGDFDVVITSVAEDKTWEVVLTPRRAPLAPNALQALVSRVKRDLVDFKTRDIIGRETQALRELLVAKAFASSDEYDHPLQSGPGIEGNAKSEEPLNAVV